MARRKQYCANRCEDYGPVLPPLGPPLPPLPPPPLVGVASVEEDVPETTAAMNINTSIMPMSMPVVLLFVDPLAPES
jgi:hypothetical protein